MTPAAASLARRRRDPWAIASFVLRAAALAALVYLATRTLLGTYEGAEQGTAVWRLVVAGGVYLSAHAFRILRLGLLVSGWQAGLRDIASFHLFTAAASLAVPLKLGEVYRVAELSNIAGGPVRAIVIVWWERAFDIAAILVLLIAALASGSEAAGQLGGVAAIAALFMAATAAVFFVVPENLRRVSILIIRRYATARTVPVLRAVDLARRAILEAPRVIENKVASLMTLTALIWSCEAVCFALVLPALADSVDGALAGLLRFLSAVTQGETLLGALEGAGGLHSSLLPYLLATQAPLVVLGLLAGIYYMARRLKSGSTRGTGS